MGTIEAIASAINSVTGLLGSWLAERAAQRYREQQLDAQRRWRDALESRDPARIHAAVRELLDQIGQPVADLEDQPATINVPVDYLDELVQCGFRLRCLDQQLASLQQALKK